MATAALIPTVLGSRTRSRRRLAAGCEQQLNPPLRVQPSSPPVKRRQATHVSRVRQDLADKEEHYHCNYGR